eukprot:207413_1
MILNRCALDALFYGLILISFGDLTRASNITAHADPYDDDNVDENPMPYDHHKDTRTMKMATMEPMYSMTVRPWINEVIAFTVAFTSLLCTICLCLLVLMRYYKSQYDINQLALSVGRSLQTAAKTQVIDDNSKDHKSNEELMDLECSTSNEIITMPESPISHSNERIISSQSSIVAMVNE